MSSFYLLNGWGLNESVLRPLQQQLAKYRPCTIINVSDYHQTSLTLSLEKLKEQIPTQSLVIGWSLGGMLAMQLAAMHPLKAVVCLGSNLRFVSSPTWPTAMPQAQFTRFYQNTLTTPNRNLMNFLRLCTQGESQLRPVSNEWIDTQLSHQAQIEGLHWLEGIDNTSLLSDLDTPQLHVFAERDALVPMQAQSLLAQRYPYISSYVLPAASHAFPFSQSQLVFQLIASFIYSF